MSEAAAKLSYVDRAILDIGTNDGWASFLKLLKAQRDCPLWFMIGARRIGKTDLILQIQIILWLRYGRKTVWLREILETVKDKSFRADFLNDAYEYGWIEDPDTEHTYTVREDGVYDPNGIRFIKFLSVSTYSSRRGPGHPDVDLIVFDEFIPEDRRYARGCLRGLMSLTKTILSGREGTRTICTSNFISLSNPYFAGLEIYPDRDSDVSVYHEKGVAVEKCRGYKCAIAEDGSWSRVYTAAGYGDYASEDEDEMRKLVKPVPKGARPDKWALTISGKWYRIWTASNGMRYARQERIENIPHQTLLYQADPRDMSENILILDPLRRISIDNDIAAGRLRYETANVLFAFVNLMYNI